MRPINIVTGNHGDSPVHMEDIIRYLICGFESLGLLVNINRHISFNETNVIIECFNEHIVDVITSAMNRGTQFIIIATEHITGTTFNEFNIEGSSHYEDRPYWNLRYQTFRQLADKCLAIWCLSESTYKNYEELYGRRVSTMPFGYVDGYARVVQRPDRLKDIDILFTGSNTQRRSRILDEFRALGCSVRQFLPSLPSFIRENVVSRAKISLAMPQSDDWIYQSDIRTYYHLVNRSFIALESLERASPLDQYSEIISKEQYVGQALEIIRSGAYSKTADLNLERFVDERPLRPQLVELLVHSLLRD
jgi:hypothetical protein